MAIRSIEKPQWQGYFDDMSTKLTGKQVEIEVAGLELGSQVEAEWLPLSGITYDPGSDVLHVATDKLGHMILHPVEISVRENAGSLAAVEVRSASGRSEIIRLRDAVPLPSPMQI